jgi:hypothetical protein
MDRAELQGGDEAWIAKYREALKVSSVQTSGFVKLRVVLEKACQSVLSRLRKTWDRGTPGRRPRSIAAREVATFLQSHSTLPKKTEGEVANNAAAKKRKQTTGRLKAGRATENRRAQRRA